MPKERTTISIDGEVLHKAKALNINVSEFLEHKLREQTRPNVKEMHERDLAFKCSRCSEVIEEGFFCKESNKVFCEGCHNVMLEKTWTCGMKDFEQKGEHMHFKFPSKLLKDPNGEIQERAD